VNKPHVCDIDKLSSAATSIVSRCFGGGGNQIAKKTTSIFHIDNIQFEFKLEPELDQVLIEGDTLELGCRFKKVNQLKSHTKHKTSETISNLVFLDTHLKWYLNKDNQITEIDTNKFDSKPPYINLFETNHKIKNDLIIESKLLIKGVKSALNSGKYFCSTLNMRNSKLNNLNTTLVEISTLNRNNDNNISEEDLKVKPLKKMLYCKEFVTNTYKGSFKWPRTQAGTRSTQKCVIQDPHRNNKEASLMCDSNGNWLNTPNIEECQFESNLTRHVQLLTKLDLKTNSLKLNSNVSLDDLIHKLVSFQIGDYNPYDIIYIQRFLIASFNVTNKNHEKSWQFIWINDMLAKLSSLEKAKSLDPLTFSTYFKRCLIPIVIDKILHNPSKNNTNHEITTTNVSESMLSSSYLTSVYISSRILGNKTLNNTNRLACYLDKYGLSQQIYFKCFLANNQSTTTTSITTTTRIELDSNLTNHYLNTSEKKNKIVFMLFENSNLFPIQFKTFNLSYTDLNKVNQLISYEDYSNENSNQTSQIFGMVSSSDLIRSEFNITLEIKMPAAYYRLLAKIESKLIDKQKEIWNKFENNQSNQSNSSIKIFEKEKNPFDQIFTTGDLTPVVVENQNYTLDELDNLDVTDSAKIKNLRNNLFNKWFSIKNYEIIYANMSESSTNQLNCSLVNLDLSFKLDLDFSQQQQQQPIVAKRLVENTYRLYAKIKCQVNELIQKNKTNDSMKIIQFISLKNTYKIVNEIETASLKSIIQMIDQYMTLFNMNDVSFFNLIRIMFKTNYLWFTNRIVYFSSFTSCILLISTIISYLISSKTMLMPRSFYHVLINIWLCMLMLILTFIFGLNQINIAYVCFPTAFILHYLTLCTSLWYTIYFYSLFFKLNTLKKRNSSLIFDLMQDDIICKKKDELKKLTKKNKKQNDYDDDDEEEDEYTPKPVVHLYMLGWGLPLLLCSIVISIEKRDYLTAPFSTCFSNEKNILINTLILPVIVMFMVKLIFIVLIAVTLNRIVKDLKKDPGFSDNGGSSSDDENNKMSANELKDKLEMCQNWTENKENNQKQTNSDSEQNQSNECAEGLGGKISSASSISNMNSDRTSVMDTQHKPNVQLKFACISLLLYIVSWLIGACYALSPIFTKIHTTATNHLNYVDQFDSNESKMNDLFKKSFSYLLSIFLFIYALLQISFYVLSRDDIVLFERKQKNYYFSKNNRRSPQKNWSWFLNIFKIGENKIRKISESSSISNNNNNNIVNIENNIIETNQNNWYYAPPENQQLPNINYNDENDCAAKFDHQSEKEKIYDEQQDVTNNEHRVSICDVLFSAKKDSPTKEHQEITGLIPSLATMEETTSETYIESIKNTKEEENPYSKCNNKKSFHVRNPSILSGSVVQNIQVLNGSHYLQDSNSSKTLTKTLNKNSNKKPPYVFVDYKYEEKILKTPNSNPIKAEPMSNEQLTNKSSRMINKKTKLTDLLMNSCSVNTGTAIDSLPDMITTTTTTTSSSSNNQTLSSCLILKNKLDFKGTNSNGSESATTSLSVSSSNTVSSLNFNNNLMNELNIYKENLNEY